MNENSIDNKNKNQNDTNDIPRNISGTISNDLNTFSNENNLSNNNFLNASQSTKVLNDNKENENIKNNFNINTNENETSSIDENNDNNSCDNNNENLEENYSNINYNPFTVSNEEDDYYESEYDLKKYGLDNIEYKLVERNNDQFLDNLNVNDEFKSMLYSFDSTLIDQKDYNSSKLVLTVDDDDNNFDNLNHKNQNTNNDNIVKKINNDRDDFIDEDLVPNQLNISNDFDNNKNDNSPKIKNENEFSNTTATNSTNNLTSYSMNKINSNNEVLESNMNSKETDELLKCSLNLLMDDSEANNQNEEVIINQNLNEYNNTKKYDYIISNKDNLLSEKETNKFDCKIINDHDENILNENNEEIITLDENDEDNEENENDDSLIKAFVWSETEAFIQQHEQTSASGCGATAILNVLKALNFQFDYETVCSKIKINTRIPESQASVTTLAQYLFSRSVAGMNACELIKNIETTTDGKITGRFFAFWPTREINLAKWLAKWIRNGAIPTALLNLQKMRIWGFIPDAWHFQMIYGVENDSVYLTNPLEIKSIDSIMNELNSDSVLLVRSSDVIKRFNSNNTNLIDLLLMKNHSSKERKRWFDMNVIGQVISVLRESKSIANNSNSFNINRDFSEATDSLEMLDINNQDHVNLFSNDLNYLNNNENINQSQQLTTNGLTSNTNSSNSNITKTHIAIPAAYVPGIVLFCYKDSNLYREIMSAAELPLKNN